MPLSYWERKMGRRLSRRAALRGGAVGIVGIAGAVLIGCSDDDADDAGGGGAATGTTAPGTVAPGTGGTTEPSTSDVPRGGTLNVGWADEPPNLDPHKGFSGAEHKYLYMVYDHLVGYGPDGLLDPGRSLAESWEQVEPTKLILKLRSGVTIQDSDEAVDSELVKWNLERASADDGTARSDLVAIDSVEAAGPNEVVINLSQSFAPLLTNFGDRGGFIVSRRAVEELGDDEFSRNPLGSGLFKLTKWISDASLTFEANKNHWRTDSQGNQMPYVDTIEHKVIPDATVRVAALESGEIDISDTPSADFDRLNARDDLQLGTFVGSSTGHNPLNHAFAPLDNERFRKGFAHSIDRQILINNFFIKDLYVEGAQGLLTPASWAWDPGVKGYTFDLVEARKHLEASGLPEDEWVVIAQPKGASISQREEFMAASVAEAGIKIQWNDPVQSGNRLHFFKGFGADGIGSILLDGGWSMRVDPHANVGQWYIQDAAYNGGQAPVPEVEPLVLKAAAELDIDERKALYTEIQNTAAEHVYSSIINYYGVRTDHASLRVGNIEGLFGGEGKRRWGELSVKDA